MMLSVSAFSVQTHSLNDVYGRIRYVDSIATTDAIGLCFILIVRCNEYFLLAA